MAVTVDAEGLQVRAREAWHMDQVEKAAAKAAVRERLRERHMFHLADRIRRFLGCRECDVHPQWEESLDAPVVLLDGLRIAQDHIGGPMRLVKKCPRCEGWMISYGFEDLAGLGRVLEMAEETRWLLHECPTDESLHRPVPPPEPTVAERLLQALEAYIAALVDERVPGVSG